MTREEMREKAIDIVDERLSAGYLDIEDFIPHVIAFVRAETLEEAARVIENDCHDDMTRAEEAAAIRALKNKP